jgi:hypothetical protein
MPRRRNSAGADDASTTSVTIFFNAPAYQNYAHTISSGTEWRPHCPLPSLRLATSSPHQHAPRNQTYTYARTPAHGRSTYLSTQIQQSLTTTSKAAPTPPSGQTSPSRHNHHRPRSLSAQQMSSKNLRPTPIHIFNSQRNANSDASQNATRRQAHQSPETT